MKYLKSCFQNAALGKNIKNTAKALPFIFYFLFNQQAFGEEAWDAQLIQDAKKTKQECLLDGGTKDSCTATAVYIYEKAAKNKIAEFNVDKHCVGKNATEECLERQHNNANVGEEDINKLLDALENVQSNSFEVNANNVNTYVVSY